MIRRTVLVGFQLFFTSPGVAAGAANDMVRTVRCRGTARTVCRAGRGPRARPMCPISWFGFEYPTLSPTFLNRQTAHATDRNVISLGLVHPVRTFSRRLGRSPPYSAPESNPTNLRGCPEPRFRVPTARIPREWRPRSDPWWKLTIGKNAGRRSGPLGGVPQAEGRAG